VITFGMKNLLMYPLSHVLLDVWTRERSLLERAGEWESLLTGAARSAGAEVIHFHARESEPVGVAAFAMLARANIGARTYPNEGLVTLDACGSGAHMGVMIASLRDALKLVRAQMSIMERGQG
jgi:S-adenosylmethionine/arginine decarboxylase-like enzyme